MGAGGIGRAGSGSGGGGGGATGVTFPIDFFEHCSLMSNDSIEFGGSDVLQVYNVQQLKHRLTSVSLYIANTKISGFQLEVTCHDPNQVVVGIRVLLGCQDVGRIPSYIEVLGRTLSIAGNPTPITRSRWFEFPLTREESLQGTHRRSSGTLISVHPIIIDLEI